VVATTIRARRADADVPFGITFEDSEDLVRVVASLHGASTPLWHLAFLDPGMTRAKGLGDGCLLFGAYPEERALLVQETLGDASGSHYGRILSAAESYRTWGERFFPVAHSRPTPTSARRSLTAVPELAEALLAARERPANAALQGTVARSGEVLLLTFDAREEGWA
jgi:hypothetical protein